MKGRNAVYSIEKTEKQKGRDMERKSKVQKVETSESDAEKTGCLIRDRQKDEREGLELGFELFVFTVDLDLISIQLRHAVNAKRGIFCVLFHITLA